MDYTEEPGHQIWKERQHQMLFVNAVDTTLISSDTVGLRQENTARPENIFVKWMDKSVGVPVHTNGSFGNQPLVASDSRLYEKSRQHVLKHKQQLAIT